MLASPRLSTAAGPPPPVKLTQEMPASLDAESRLRSILSHQPAQAGDVQTAQLGAIADTFVASRQPTLNLGDFEGMWAGSYNEEQIGWERGLVQFDLSSIPQGATIHGAALFVALGGYHNEADMSLTAYRVTAPWGENEATWENMAGNFEEAYDSVEVGTEVDWYPLDVTELVQAWVDGRRPNHGIMLRGPEHAGTHDRGFFTREVDPRAAPQLGVIYTPDTVPPQARIRALPAYTRTPLTVEWTGLDRVGRIKSYEVQYRAGTSGPWEPLTQTANHEAPFSGEPGERYCFRVRATDYAGHTLAWEETLAPECTTLYLWRISGSVTDNWSVPVTGAAVQISPAPLNDAQTDTEGCYTAYLSQAGRHSLDAEHEKFGSLPTTEIEVGVDREFNVILPPPTNLIQNGGFETGDLAGWHTMGVAPPTITTDFHTGRHAVRLGQPASAEREAAIGDSTITQTVNIPAEMQAPTLSFVYQQLNSPGEDTAFGVTVGEETVFSTPQTVTEWTPHAVDLTPWQDQAVSIGFTQHETAEKPARALLDEVAVGPAYPDSYADIGGTRAALPGNDVRFVVRHGNRSRVPATDATLILTPPAGIVDIVADPNPTVRTDSALHWNLGTLTGDNRASIEVRGRIEPTTEVGLPLTSHVTLNTSSTEANVENNSDVITTTAHARAYLPLVMHNTFP